MHVGLAVRAYGMLNRPWLGAVVRFVMVPLRGVPMTAIGGNGRGLKFSGGQLIRLVSSLEPEVEACFLAAIGPEALVSDVGANIGWYSLLAARRTGPRGRVVAFEPDSANVTSLRRNVRRNGFHNLLAVPAAVADHEGWQAFRADGGVMGKLDDAGTALVPVVTLDSWHRQAATPAPDVVKIDVEGAEVAVIAGMAEILRSARPTLIIELHGETNDAVADALEAHGYQHSPIDVPGTTRTAPFAAHILATPR